jgi:transcriptional regulator NrdR family protein
MKCPTCGTERWKKGTAPHVEVVDGRKFKGELAARICVKCGEAIVTLEELDRFAVAVALELAQAGARSGDAIRVMRRRSGSAPPRSPSCST